MTGQAWYVNQIIAQIPSLVFGREVVFPGLSQEDAEREARAMVERGEVAADDFVLGMRAWPLGPVRIRRLPAPRRNIAHGSTRYLSLIETKLGETLPEPGDSMN